MTLEGDIKRYLIFGDPAILKNSRRIVISGGRRILIGSKKVEAAQIRALEQLASQHTERGPAFAADAKLNVQFHFYIKAKASSKNLPDLSNLYQFPEDMLETAGVIADDRQIEGHDGSRRICLCDDCEKRSKITRGPRYGHRKDTCGNMKACTLARIEITLREMK